MREDNRTGMGKEYSKDMIREPWDYDYYSHKVILNVGADRSSRRRERNIGTGLLNRPRLVVLIVVITILLGLFLKEARSVLASNPQFIIQDVILENTNLINKDTLYDILKMDSPKGIFNVSANEIARILEKDPDIEGAVVEKILPGTLKIIISERVPYARLDIDGKEYYIDYNGILLWRKREKGSIPVIAGLKINPATRWTSGESCMVPELENILNVLRTGDSLGWGGFIEPVSVRVINEDYISIYTRERILIKLKLDNIDKRLDKLMVVLNDARKKGRLIKMVDLRFKDVYVE